ncbi:MAG: hypothetical protein RL429_482, partial [Bacteroidota bacterium]
NVDNWRLRSKSNEWAQQTAEKQAKGPSAEPSNGGEAGSEGDSATATAAAGEPAGRYDVAGYLAKIPRNPEERAAVQMKACEAWSEVAAAYRDGMQDPSEAVTAYRKALRSCPDHPEASRWLYAVHRLHVALKENVQAEAALKELLERYPSSEAAQIVRKGSAGASKGAEPAATPAFIALSKAVDQRNWPEALRLYQTTVWTEPERAPAALLRALAVGGSQGRAAYADALRKVATEFPSTPQAAAAQTYLVAISTIAAPEPVVNAENLKLFSPAPQAPHQVAILFPTGFDGNAVRNALARIHSTDFPDRPLGVRALPWNENAELLVVDGFKNAAEALAYRDAMRQNADLRKMLPAERTTFWPVTVANFSHLYRTKDEAAYRAFVQRNYGSP